MEPREFDCEINRKQPVEALHNLKELMGDRAYYDWLAEKFPNNVTRALLDKQAELLIGQLSLEIRIQITLYLRVQAYKDELDEFLAKQDEINDKAYMKERTAIINRINTIKQDHLRQISEDLKDLEATKFSKQKVANLLMLIDSKLKEYKAAIQQYQDTMARVDIAIKKYTTVISDRINSHIDEINHMVSLISQDSPELIENRYKIDQLSQQIRERKMSISEYKNNVMNVLKPIIEKIPNLIGKLNHTLLDIKATEIMEQKIVKLGSQREILYQQMIDTQHAEVLLKQERRTLFGQDVKKNEVELVTPNASSSSLIMNLLSKAEANVADLGEEELNTSGLADKVLNILENDHSEDDELLANVLNDLDEAENSLESELKPAVQKQVLQEPSDENRLNKSILPHEGDLLRM